ncbi:hypothetical protein R1sor_016115 [Riccia sorocarpa]|uniref:Uncharacterized protein n=1 Tax=Riccia sorocarpa TaxID=122646 RepID=A0ABD3HFY7_9MARC
MHKKWRRWWGSQPRREMLGFTPTSSSGDNNMGVIGGSAVGAVAILAILGSGLIIIIRRWRWKSEENNVDE